MTALAEVLAAVLLLSFMCIVAARLGLFSLRLGPAPKPRPSAADGHRADARREAGDGK